MIRKEKLRPYGKTVLQLPADYKILAVKRFNEEPVLFYLSRSPGEGVCSVTVEGVGTGYKGVPEGEYLGSLKIGGFYKHYFLVETALNFEEPDYTVNRWDIGL